MVMIVNCNYQRLDGPVRGNSKASAALEWGTSVRKGVGRGKNVQEESAGCTVAWIFLGEIDMKTCCNHKLGVEVPHFCYPPFCPSLLALKTRRVAGGRSSAPTQSSTSMVYKKLNQFSSTSATFLRLPLSLHGKIPSLCPPPKKQKARYATRKRVWGE